MKIDKYKRMSTGKYKVLFVNGQELLLWEEVILKYDLLLKKEIDSNTFDDIRISNQMWDVYYDALKCLKRHFMSIGELKNVLIRKEYNIDLIEAVLEKLIEQKYLDDDLFCSSYINSQLMSSNKGPNKICLELTNKGVSSEIVYSKITVFTKELQEEKIRKLISKGLKGNHTRGGNVLKNKIISDLVNLGYDCGTILGIIDNYDFFSNDLLAKKEYDKLYRTLSKKYSGEELLYRIKQRMYQKGFDYEKQIEKN